ncbi:uncharacterized protein LOC121189217 isoform X2 [Toxotes jaculatrix]|uniref:uncharacterized protein LOC121189217 isoform X2 n=1 Tax=Toxotes jaculatrix TaxID=941984 RepID=UPI001B3AB3D9|nr:uncharacterized protein LOC121189217 isoform X2 [Toxotes jaculatrix]
MTSPYIIHLLTLVGFTRIHSEIITVSEVSVKTGDSISIPCLYEDRYTKHVKYLCKGSSFQSCKIVVRTDRGNGRSGRFSIYDDTNQRIFSVSICDLTDKDSDYWCAVKRIFTDVEQRFRLSVSTGMSSLYVDQQEITAFEGGSVTVVCHYKYPEATEWCRLGGTCVREQTGLIDRTPVTINTSVPNVFSVTMTELRTESSGWYLCVKEGLQIPVHITVHELTSTTTTISPNTARTLSTTHQHSSLVTSTEPHMAHATNTTIATAGGESLQDEHKSSTKVTILTTTLVLQLLVLPAAFFGWRTLRHNKTKPEGSDVTVESQAGSDPEEHYSTVVHNQHVAAQKKDHKKEESVIYSTVVINDSVQQMAEPTDGSVIYSTVHKQK